MLLLVTIGLVLVGAVSLVIGFVSNSLGPIYLSIACSVIAGIVLVVFSRMARRQEGGPSSAMPSAPSPGSWAPPAASSPPPPQPSSSLSDREAPTFQPAPLRPLFEREPEPEPEPEPAPLRTATLGSLRRQPAADLDLEEDDEFPIPGYDRLRASQILAELDGLSLDELDMVREREEQGKNRSTVIRRVDALIDELEAAEDAGAPAPEPEPVAAAVEEPDVLEPEPAAPMSAGDFAMTSADEDFPIPDYDDLSADEIIAQLDDLSDDELDQVAEREEQGRNRAEILDYIDGMFEEVEEEVPGAAATAVPSAPIAPPPPPPAPAAKKAKAPAAKKAAVKKAPPVKVPVKKMVTAKKAPAKVAPVKTAGRVAGAGAGKAVASKAAGRTAPAKVAAPPPAAPAVKAPAPRVASKRAAKAVPAPVKAAKKAPRTPAAPVKKADQGPVEKAKAAVKKVAKAAAKRVPGKKA